MAVEFVIEECKQKAALSATPLRKMELRLDEIGERFPSLAATRQMLVIELSEGASSVEVIVNRDGKLLFKECHDPALARRLAERIYGVGSGG